MSDLNPTKKVKIQHSRNAWQAADDGKLHPDDASGYVLPIATKTVLGGMRVGDRLSVTPLGTVSADDQHYDDTEIREEIDAKQDELVSGETIRTVNGHTLLGSGNLVIEGGDEYVLPPATAATLGGVKKGSRVTIAEDGTISADDQTFDPTSLQTAIAGNTQGIVDANVRIDGKQDTLVSGTSIKTVNGENLLGAGNIVIGGGGGEYTLPPATSETLGGVKTGARVTIALDGTISADDMTYNDTEIRSDLAATNVRVTGVEDDVEALTPRVSAVEGEIVTLDGQVEDLTEDVAANTTAIAGKQATLVSGTNLKTVNGESLLGSGNVVIGGGGTVTAGDGLRKTGDVISARVDRLDPVTELPNSGLIADAEGLGIRTGNGIAVNPDNALQVLINPDSLKYTTFGGVYQYLDVKLADDSIRSQPAGLSVQKYTNADSISFSVDGAGLITIGVFLASNSGLETIAFDGLRVKCDPNGGIERVANGIRVKPKSLGGLLVGSTGVEVYKGNGMRANSSGAIEPRGPRWGATETPALAALFTSASCELRTMSKTAATMTPLSGLTSSTRSEQVNYQSGLLTFTHTGNLTNLSGASSGNTGYAARARLNPGRTDIFFLGTARVSVTKGGVTTVRIVPFNGAKDIREYGESGGYGIGGVVLPAPRNHLYPSFDVGVTFSGLDIDLDLELGTTQVKIEYPFLTPGTI